MLDGAAAHRTELTGGAFYSDQIFPRVEDVLAEEDATVVQKSGFLRE